MAYQINQIKSIELERSKAFNHFINIKDGSGFILEAIPVKEHNEMEQFNEVIKAWFQHPEYKGN